MSQRIDIHFLEILSSKICHDLISPIGAVNNGIEFMTEMGEDAGSDGLDLVAFSAAQASAKLQVFRLAYGVGGADSHIKPEDVHEAVESLISPDGKITQDWDPHAPLGIAKDEFGLDERSAAYSKILTCAILLAIECLPKGGKFSIEGQPDGSTLVRAEGENSGLRDNTAAALCLSISTDNMNPKYVHAYMSGLLARHHGYEISADDSAESQTLIRFIKI